MSFLPVGITMLHINSVNEIQVMFSFTGNAYEVKNAALESFQCSELVA